MQWFWRQGRKKKKKTHGGAEIGDRFPVLQLSGFLSPKTAMRGKFKWLSRWLMPFLGTLLQDTQEQLASDFPSSLGHKSTACFKIPYKEKASENNCATAHHNGTVR